MPEASKTSSWLRGTPVAWAQLATAASPQKSGFCATCGTPVITTLSRAGLGVAVEVGAGSGSLPACFVGLGQADSPRHKRARRARRIVM